MSLSAIQTQASCADDYDPNSLPVPEALNRIDQLIEPLAGHERLALRSALGRVLAEPVTSPLDVPAHDNSAMDGYALRADDLRAEGAEGARGHATVTLRVAGTALAGKPFAGRVEAGQAVRIMTGAVLPEGADTVVMQEHAEVSDDGSAVRVEAEGTPRGQNTRRAGEDLRRGDQVFAPGRLLSPADIGVIASLGLAELNVTRRLRVAFFSTGDELRSLGETLADGQIYDSNRYTLYGMLTRLGADIIDMGVVPDRPELLREALQTAAGAADAVITSGGVSVGEADYVKDTLRSLGQVDFWKIAMKPGRPLAFGKIGNAVFFGLPGNPVSVMVTFYQFVQPALARMAGQTAAPPLLFSARAGGDLKKRPGRMEFQRGVLERDAGGELLVHGTGDQGSGILSTMSRANCFIVLGDDCAGIKAGDRVDVQPFDQLV